MAKKESSKPNAPNKPAKKITPAKPVIEAGTEQASATISESDSEIPRFEPSDITEVRNTPSDQDTPTLEGLKASAAAQITELLQTIATISNFTAVHSCLQIKKELGVIQRKIEVFV